MFSGGVKQGGKPIWARSLVEAGLLLVFDHILAACDPSGGSPKTPLIIS